VNPIHLGQDGAKGGGHFSRFEGHDGEGVHRLRPNEILVISRAGEMMSVEQDPEFLVGRPTTYPGHEPLVDVDVHGSTPVSSFR
jgi:hypothetical protein